MNKLILKTVVPKIGRLLKIYREKTGKNQGDIAECANISVSMLSQIERGMVAPSVETLVAVCSALDLEPSELFKNIESGRSVHIHHKDERLRNMLSGVRYEQLMTSSHPSYKAELFLIEVDQGCTTSFCGDGHEGAEMGYVLFGEATLIIDNESYYLVAGDSFYFNARLPHQLMNCGESLFRAVWSISPPHVDFLGITTKHDL